MTRKSARALLAKLLGASLYFSGLVPLARWMTRLAGPRLIILTYHRSSDGPLRHHLCYLRRHYRVLPLEQALQGLYGGSSQPRAGPRQRTAVALTFDDGYLDTYLYAATRARELRVPITVFLIPGYLDGGDSFWWYETKRLAMAARVDQATIAGCTYQLNRPEQRRALARALYDAAYCARSVAEREAVLAQARETLDVRMDGVEDDPEGRPLTWAQVREMQETGWIQFGGHTLHHPVLGSLVDPAEVMHEVRGCRGLLQRRLGDAVRCFAYPLGRAEHIGADGVRAVREAGYDWAVTTLRGVNTAGTDPHLLHRMGVSGGQDWMVLAADMAGLWPMAGLRRARRALGGGLQRASREHADASD